MEDGVLLRLGPQTFTAHISPQGGEGIQGKQQDEKLSTYQQRHCPDCEVQLTGDGHVPEPATKKEPVAHWCSTCVTQIGAVRTPAPLDCWRCEDLLHVSAIERRVPVAKSNTT